jgi:hypothetical protein
MHQILSHLAQLLSRATALMRGWVAFAASHFETGTMILTDEPGDEAADQLGSRVVIFCHFDGQGRIRDHIRTYIDALIAEQLDLVFVTNSGSLAPLDHAWIRLRASRILLRRNLGYDFAAWRDAMTACGLPRAETHLLLIVNDSVYGPLRPLGPMLAKIDFEQADIWGVTDSWQHRFHLQSFFVAFGPRALQHEAFARFWGQVGNVRSKWWIVRRYELGLSRVFIASGLKCRALWPYIDAIDALRKSLVDPSASNEATAALSNRRPQAPREPFDEARRGNAERVLRAALQRVPLNPTADLWRVLIEQGCPFLKRELLRANPSRIPDVAGWSPLVGAIDESYRNAIMRDLEVSLKNQTP